jgi:[ribosomal protein S5]-alanine N-acetyltransferase
MKKTAQRKNALEAGSVVYLRSPQMRDGGELMALNRASLRLYRGLVSPILTPQRFADYIKRCNQADFEGFLVCRIIDDAIVGSINLSQIFRGGFQSAYLGYQIGAPFAGQGYMTAAMDLLLRHVFRQMKLHRLEANIQPGNTASIALVKRAGFIKEGYSRRYLKIAGRWRDHERWAIVAEDWGARKRLQARHHTSIGANTNEKN